MMQASGTSSSNSSFSKKQLVQQRTTTTDSEPTISYPLVKLPHPFLTEYCITPNTTTPATLTLKHLSQPAEGTPLTFSLHNDSLSFLPLAFLPSGQVPKKADNTSWARARRAPFTQFAWTNDAAPSLAQIWNLIHAIYLTHPAIEYFRLTLSGTKNALIRKELLTTGLAVPHPKLWGFDKEKRNVGDETDFTDELLVLRATFWQGAGSPAGPRPIWACSSDHQPAFLKPILAAKSGQGEDRVPSSLYPPFPHTQHFTMSFPAAPVYALHPVRAPKPTPGSIVYSRYIPSLNEHFSLEALDWEDEEHVKLFNEWQNDERVAEGWNERGTIEEHTAYLKGLGEDPHVLCLFGRFEGVRMAYFELYWAAVSSSSLFSISDLNCRDSHISVPLCLDVHPPIFVEYFANTKTGRSFRRPLFPLSIRTWPPLPSRQSPVPRPRARECMVQFVYPLLLPRRAAYHACGR